ncbi:MAG TPA: MFS transporter [Tessaracoccus flavescens]|uniref:MFS transporter n=1 Tax=Tessaracoccus flavescens TaxID=399497 RepID=A0A921ES12_9ACTN|nr:MFS transporter [Tessaracoccus flavescens]
MAESSWKTTTALFMTSQGFSLLGSMLVQYALMWHLTITTQSGEVMTLAIIVGFIPMLLISPFAGAWADRLPKRMLIAAADALAALSTVALFIALLFGYDDLWVILAAMGLRAVGQAIQSPAVSAILPEIVPEEHLLRINGYNGALQSGVGLVSPLLAGALLTLMPMQWVLLIDVVTAAFAIVIMLVLVKVAHTPSDAEPVGALRDIRDGFVYVWQHRFVRRLFWYFAVSFFLAAPVSFLTPLQVTRSYSNDVWRLTVIEMAFFVGMMLGGVLIGQWGGFRRKAATVAAAIVVMGAFAMLLGLEQPFWLYSAWMLLTGVFMPFMNAPTMTLLQTKVEPKFLGRVMSVMMMISTSVMPLGMLVFGPMADRVRIEWILLATGGLMVIGGLLMLLDRTIRRGEPRVAEATAS